MTHVKINDLEQEEMFQLIGYLPRSKYQLLKYIEENFYLGKRKSFYLKQYGRALKALAKRKLIVFRNGVWEKNTCPHCHGSGFARV